MKITGPLRLVVDSRFATDASVVLHEGKFLMSVHVPVNGVNCIAVSLSEDGFRFPDPRVVLRPDPKRIGVTYGAETPSPIRPPFTGFPYWSMMCMGYGRYPERGKLDHLSSGMLAIATDPLGFWRWLDIAIAEEMSRQQAHVRADQSLDGGLSEFGYVHVGNGVNAMLYATNSYRPKPAIYAATSVPPWPLRSWCKNPDPVIEGEGALWASQPDVCVIDDVPTCVYAEGPPERIRVARGDTTFTKWETGEVLIEPQGELERCVGPCLVPLGDGKARLYFTAVFDDAKRWQITAADVDLAA